MSRLGDQNRALIYGRLVDANSFVLVFLRLKGSRCLIVMKKVDCILLQVLPMMVVSHHGLRISMTTHHLDLPIAQALIQGPGDCSSPQVMW